MGESEVGVVLLMYIQESEPLLHISKGCNFDFRGCKVLLLLKAKRLPFGNPYT